MRIVVVGAGKVGVTLTNILSGEGHDVTIIDNKNEVLNETQEMLDVAVVEGNGFLVEVQRAAGVDKCDLLIAATSSDEINMLSCFIARKLGCKSTVARVRNPEYDQQLSFLKEDMGLSFSINPEKNAAREIYHILQFPSFLKRDSFSGGLVELVEVKIKEDSAFVGKRLDQLGEIWKINALVCAAERGGEVYIPSGSFTINADDKITFAIERAKLIRLVNTLKIKHKKIKHVIIVGGGRIAEYLAEMLLENAINVTIIEKDRARCEELSVTLPNALIINGDGADEHTLHEEGIERTDALVTLTGIDEENIVVSLLANHLGVSKTVTKLNRIDYTDIFANMGLDTIVSPKQLTANEIVRFVRTVGVGADSKMDNFYRIADGKVESIGFTVADDVSYLNIPLKNLRLRPNTLIASIVRNGKVMIPNGSAYMQPGDGVVVVTLADVQKISSLDDIFADR
ncbi:MAG: Trk system potassium transporter TrkA [Oscillospiraceae bacterium]|nr:Trk system potassium transporter TrkA [Oscillospiraceae bacterium]